MYTERLDDELIVPHNTNQIHVHISSRPNNLRQLRLYTFRNY